MGSPAQAGGGLSVHAFSLQAPEDPILPCVLPPPAPRWPLLTVHMYLLLEPLTY